MNTSKEAKNIADISLFHLAAIKMNVNSYMSSDSEKAGDSMLADIKDIIKTRHDEFKASFGETPENFASDVYNKIKEDVAVKVSTKFGEIYDTAIKNWTSAMKNTTMTNLAVLGTKSAVITNLEMAGSIFIGFVAFTLSFKGMEILTKNVSWKTATPEQMKKFEEELAEQRSKQFEEFYEKNKNGNFEEAEFKLELEDLKTLPEQEKVKIEAKLKEIDTFKAKIKRTAVDLGNLAAATIITVVISLAVDFFIHHFIWSIDTVLEQLPKAIRDTLRSSPDYTSYLTNYQDAINATIDDALAGSKTNTSKFDAKK